MDLNTLRKTLDGIDRQVIELIAQRQSTVRDIARFKQSTGFPLRDFGRERKVLEGARAVAQEVGVAPDVAESVMRHLIRYSLTLQEQDGMSAHRHGDGRRALVIGGSGKMGNWFVQFLDSQGFDVEVSDPAATAKGTVDWRSAELDHEFIVVATPLGLTNAVLQELAQRRPSGLVCDLASLKSPLRSGLIALRAAGISTASIHPMFGPDIELLAGQHVVFVDIGDSDGLARIQSLFSPTMVSQVVLNLDEHDRLMAFVLGMSHAVNIAFFTALSRSGETAASLLRVSGTTFANQFDVARRVAAESPSLYYDIQALNDFGKESLEALRGAVNEVFDSVSSADRDRFIVMMESGRQYTADRRQVSRDIQTPTLA
jgi:chorismate mutase / prephenate dehydrogenase